MGGVYPSLAVEYNKTNTVVEKSGGRVEYKINMPDKITAPIQKGEKIGDIRFICGEKEILLIDITAGETVEKIDLFHVFFKVLCAVSIY